MTSDYTYNYYIIRFFGKFLSTDNKIVQEYLKNLFRSKKYGLMWAIKISWQKLIRELEFLRSRIHREIAIVHRTNP